MEDGDLGLGRDFDLSREWCQAFGGFRVWIGIGIGVLVISEI